MKKDDKISKKHLIYLTTGIVFIAFMPIVFTSFSLVSFENTGEIGDTIGGITAPFIGVIAALLVYKSFLAQIESNNLLRKETTFNFVNQLANHALNAFSVENKSTKPLSNNTRDSVVYFYNDSVTVNFHFLVSGPNDLENNFLIKFDKKSVKLEYFLKSFIEVTKQISDSFEGNNSMKRYFLQHIYQDLKDKGLFDIDVLCKVEEEINKINMEKTFIDKGRFLSIERINTLTIELSNRLKEYEE